MIYYFCRPSTGYSVPIYVYYDITILLYTFIYYCALRPQSLPHRVESAYLPFDRMCYNTYTCTDELASIELFYCNTFAVVYINFRCCFTVVDAVVFPTGSTRIAVVFAINIVYKCQVVLACVPPGINPSVRI